MNNKNGPAKPDKDKDKDKDFFKDIVGQTHGNKPLSYDASNIKVLEGLEAVRRRPGMYVGGTDVKALHHLIFEVVDNSINEALAGFCNEITVIIFEDDSVTIIDNGRGIPIHIHQETKVSTLQWVMTTLHADWQLGGSSYKVSGGMHGFGVSAVNALSEWCEVEVACDGKIYFQRYEKGVPQETVRVVGKVPKTQTGTTTTFKYDPTIFKDAVTYKSDLLTQRFREIAFVTRGVTIRFEDKREDKQFTFYFEGGISSFVKFLNQNRVTLHDVVYVEKEIDNVGVEVAIQYTDAYSESVCAFANTINTNAGGTHLTGLRMALTRSINDYARKNSLLKDDDPNFSGEDTREGLTAIVSIKHPDPKFQSAIKVKLMNTEVQTYVQQVVYDSFSNFLEQNSVAARKIIQKCLTSARSNAA